MTQGQIGWGKKGIVGRNSGGGRECAVVELGWAMGWGGPYLGRTGWGGLWFGRAPVREGCCLRRIVGQGDEGGPGSAWWWEKEAHWGPFRCRLPNVLCKEGLRALLMGEMGKLRMTQTQGAGSYVTLKTAGTDLFNIEHDVPKVEEKLTGKIFIHKSYAYMLKKDLYTCLRHKQHCALLDIKVREKWCTEPVRSQLPSP